MVESQIELFVVNAVQSFGYFLLLMLSFLIKELNKYHASIMTLIIGVIFVFSYNEIFLHYSGAYFEFTGSDSTTYHKYSTLALEFNFIEGLRNFTQETKYGYSDVGMVAYLNGLYRVVEHPLLARYFNAFLGALTAVVLFKLSEKINDRRLVLFSVLAYSLSSAALYYQASGLKETVFVFVVVVSSYCLIKVVENRSVFYSTLSLMFTSLVFLFRVPVGLFLLLSFCSVLFYDRSVKFGIRLFFSLLMLITFISMLVLNYDLISMYLGVVNPELQEKAGGGGGIVALVAGVAGPFPTIIPFDGREADSIWGSAMLLKMFVSLFFVCGVIGAVKSNSGSLKFMAIFSTLSILSLVVIGRSLKVRYVMPYLPFYFIVSCYGYTVFKSMKIKNEEVWGVLYVGVLSLLVLSWHLFRF